MLTQAYRTETVEELDGSQYQYEYLEPKEEVLLEFMRDLFEIHWSKIVFGPLIQGAAYEIRMNQPPKSFTMLDGYLTVDLGDWHFHLCIGERKGTGANPTPAALARLRRVSKAAFYRRIGKGCTSGSWGFRMWNGGDEQMLTVMFPNPFLDERLKPQKPDWRRLALWNEMRLKYLSGATAWAPSEQEKTAGPAAH